MSQATYHPPTTETTYYAEKSLEQMLIDDNQRLKRAGFKLAEAALYVAKEHDGVHRLMLAVSEWAQAIADEGARGGGNCD